MDRKPDYTLAELQVTEALASLGLAVRPPRETPEERRADIMVDVNGCWVPIEVKSASTVMPPQAHALVEGVQAERGAVVVVADRIVATAREVLARAGWGWLDRRGRLRLTAPGVLVDTAVPAPVESPSRRRPALQATVSREVAARLLLGPEPAGVRALADDLGRAPSSVSDALAGLRAEGLVEGKMRPLVPELFWELAEHWDSPPQALSQAPHPGSGPLVDALGLGLEHVEETTGWVLSDTLAAAAYDAPVSVASGHPPDFYVPSPAALARARMLLGASEYSHRACTVRVAPVPLVCQRRVDAARRGLSDLHWPLAEPLFVALDLATDPGRGREVLANWDPPSEWNRFW